jgi:Ca-activated chloride channel family protein
MTWTFLAPHRLWFLLVIVLIAVLYVLAQFRRKRNMLRFSSVGLFDGVVTRRPAIGRHLVAALTMLGLAIGIMAAARPADDVRVQRQRATVMMAIDTSLSMKATDVTPSRIEAAKASAKHFLDQLPRALNVGLVSFDTGARVNVPPTTDRNQVKAAVDRLKLHEGTAIGDAVQTCLQAIGDVPLGDDGKRVPAVIVLLSDGETTVGTPTESAIKPAKDAGVQVSTIAFGTPDGQIEVTEPDTGRTVRVTVPVNATALAQLADGTGGTAFKAETADDLTKVYSQLGSSIGYDIEHQEVTWRYAAAAAALLSLCSLASVLWFQRLP